MAIFNSYVSLSEGMTTSPLHSNDAWDGVEKFPKLADGDLSIKYMEELGSQWSGKSTRPAEIWKIFHVWGEPASF